MSDDTESVTGRQPTVPAPDEVIKIRKCRGYTQIDNAVLRSGVSCRAMGLLLLMWSKPTGWRFSSTRLAGEVAEGREAIRTAMRELIDAGFVRCIRRGGETPGTVYWLREDTRLPWPDEAKPQVAPGAQESGAGNRGAAFSGVKVRTERSTPEVVINPSAHRSDERVRSEEPEFEDRPLAPDFEEQFTEFWKLYPHRIGKRAAKAAFSRAVHRASPEAIMAGLAARVAWWKRARTPMDKIAHPTTWLNRDSWTDEIEPTPQAAATGIVQAAADLAVRQRDEVERAIAAGDAELAWRLTRSRARGRGDHWFDKIATDIDNGRRVIVVAGLERDGRRVTQDDVAEVRAAKEQLWVACGLSLSPAVGESSKLALEGST